MTSHDPEMYKTLADIIYAESPGSKDVLNNGAQIVIEALKDALSVELSAADTEAVFSIIAAIAADILTTPVNNISEKVNMIFDIHSLAAGAVVGAVDLGDTSAAKDMVTVMREAKERSQARNGDPDENTGLFL